MLAGAAVIAVGIAIAVGLVGNFIQTPDDATLTGIASNPEFDPDNFSNETLEATLLSFEGDPEAIAQTMPMRFRLAERYFASQDYDRAFGHYRRIIESDPEPDLASAALTRVAWIVWVGNGLTDLALQTVDQALTAAPDNVEAVYVKAQIVWCGIDDPDGAVPLLASVLASDQIDDAVRDVAVAPLQTQPRLRVARPQIVEADSVLRLLRVFTVDLLHLEQRQIALALLGRPHLAEHGVAGAQIEPLDL